MFQNAFNILTRLVMVQISICYAAGLHKAKFTNFREKIMTRDYLLSCYQKYFDRSSKRDFFRFML